MHTDGLDIACQDICNKTPINDRGLIHVDSGGIYMLYIHIDKGRSRCFFGDKYSYFGSIFSQQCV